MPEHAYLITEYSNLSVAQAAIRMIDDSRNDVFIYIDEDAFTNPTSKPNNPESFSFISTRPSA